MSAASAAPRPNKNWLLVKFRQWHSWGGMFLSVFILLVAVTGILLNHKDTFFHRGEKKKDGPSGLLSSTTNFAALPVTFDRALQLAHEHYGDVALERSNSRTNMVSWSTRSTKAKEPRFASMPRRVP